VVKEEGENQLSLGVNLTDFYFEETFPNKKGTILIYSSLIY